MRLGPILLLLCLDSSYAAFGPIPYLSEIAVAKAGLGLVATKALLLKKLFMGKSEPNIEIDEIETVFETVCKLVTKQECRNEPQEECHRRPIMSCRTEQKCRTITENKCSTDGSNTHSHGNYTHTHPRGNHAHTHEDEEDHYFCDKVWFKLKCLTHCKDEPELCTPWVHERCKECNFQTDKKCWDETKEVCEPREICSENDERICNIVDKQVCYEKTMEECQKVEKLSPYV